MFDPQLRHSLAAWSRGMIPASGAGGPGFESPCGPTATHSSFLSVMAHAGSIPEALRPRFGAEEACWAHNPEVDGSKPSIAFGGFQVHNIALLAQSVERRSHNPWTFNASTRLRVGVLSSIISNPEVDGSIPPRGISGLDIHILFEDTSSGWAVYRTPSS